MHSLLQKISPVQQALTTAIGHAHERGDDAEVDALLIKKMALVRREAAAPHQRVA